MPNVLGVALEPDRADAVLCRPPQRDATPRRPHDCRPVVHHDHLLDLIHQILLDGLSPRDHDHDQVRPDGGRAFSDFLRFHEFGLLDRIAELKTSTGGPIIRFPPTLVCEKLNAVDGNGKQAAGTRRPLEVDLIGSWSMTPMELQEGGRAWDEIYAADRRKKERRDRAVAFAQTLLDEHRRRAG